MLDQKNFQSKKKLYSVRFFVFTCIVVLLAVLGSKSQSQVIFQRPSADFRIANLVHLETARSVASVKAQEVMGTQIVGSDPIFCSNSQGFLNAYMFIFKAGTGTFPTDQAILQTIRRGAAYEQQLHEGVVPEELAAKIDQNTILRRLNALKIPAYRPDGELCGMYKTLEHEELLRQARRLRFGADEFLTVYVSASYENFPIPHYKKTLPPYYAAYEEANEEAAKFLGQKTAALSKYYFLGVRGEFFEFQDSGKEVLYDPVQNKMIADKERFLRPRKGSPLAPAEKQVILNAVNLEWQKAMSGVAQLKPDEDYR